MERMGNKRLVKNVYRNMIIWREEDYREGKGVADGEGVEWAVRNVNKQGQGGIGWERKIYGS